MKEIIEKIPDKHSYKCSCHGYSFPTSGSCLAHEALEGFVKAWIKRNPPKFNIGDYVEYPYYRQSGTFAGIARITKEEVRHIEGSKCLRGYILDADERPYCDDPEDVPVERRENELTLVMTEAGFDARAKAWALIADELKRKMDKQGVTWHFNSKMGCFEIQIRSFVGSKGRPE